jgi:small subunit ribosomal protein S16
MPVKLRLRRTGVKNKPCYRVVAADSRSPRDGRFIEILGYYDPRRQDEKVDLEKIEYWLRHGAQPSETVAALIKRAKTSKTEEAECSRKPKPTEIDDSPVAETEVKSVPDSETPDETQANYEAASVEKKDANAVESETSENVAAEINVE